MAARRIYAIDNDYARRLGHSKFNEVQYKDGPQNAGERGLEHTIPTDNTKETTLYLTTCKCEQYCTQTTSSYPLLCGET